MKALTDAQRIRNLKQLADAAGVPFDADLASMKPLTLERLEKLLAPKVKPKPKKK